MGFEAQAADDLFERAVVALGGDGLRGTETFEVSGMSSLSRRPTP